jgi:hypothetical protein
MELVEREAVKLGERFQIASKWTSFVAVQEKTQATALVSKEAADFGASEDSPEAVPTRQRDRYNLAPSPTHHYPSAGVRAAASVSAQCFGYGAGGLFGGIRALGDQSGESLVHRSPAVLSAVGVSPNTVARTASEIQEAALMPFPELAEEDDSDSGAICAIPMSAQAEMAEEAEEDDEAMGYGLFDGESDSDDEDMGFGLRDPPLTPKAAPR